MKRLLIVLVLFLGCAMTGCGPTAGSDLMETKAGYGLMDTRAQRHRRIRQAHNYQWRMLVDDWDYFWLCERNSRLTEFHPRVGI